MLKSNICFPNSTSYPTPLLVAAGNGHLEVVKCFYDHNVTFDLITLHHAAARNHLNVVRFLLHTVGLRDTCIPSCQGYDYKGMTTIQEAHVCFCETALHAAVSRGLGDVAEILLENGKGSLECKNHFGKTVLMDAVERNDTEMVDLLLRHGANVTSGCGMIRWSNLDICSLKQDILYSFDCENDCCWVSSTPIHISAKYGWWEVAQKLLRGQIDEIILFEGWNGYNALDVAIIYDQKIFFKILTFPYKMWKNI